MELLKRNFDSTLHETSQGEQVYEGNRQCSQVGHLRLKATIPCTLSQTTVSFHPPARFSVQSELNELLQQKLQMRSQTSC